MRRELLLLAHQLSQRGEAFTLATVVARKPPISAQVGDMALITSRGEFHGWVGGSCTKPTVIAEARQSLLTGQARLVVLDPDAERLDRPGSVLYPMTCQSGGSVEIHIQPVLPSPRLVVYGLSPTARALMKLAAAMGYRVVAVDPEVATQALPEVELAALDATALHLIPSDQPLYCVVATQGEWDEAAVVAALSLGPQYLAVVASRRRFAEMRASLRTESNAARFDAIKNPAGLDLGAQLPEEIALSILAEMVQGQAKQRRAASEGTARVEVSPAPLPSVARLDVLASGSAAQQASGQYATTPVESSSPACCGASEQAGDSSEVASMPSEFALDPVCGMRVRVASAAHQVNFEQQDFYFCCGVCKNKFLAKPTSYLPGRALAPASEGDA